MLDTIRCRQRILSEGFFVCSVFMAFVYKTGVLLDSLGIDSATAEKYVKDTKGLKIVEDNESFGSEEYGIAVKKENEKLLEQINKVLDKMVKDGTINELSAKYSE